MAYKGNAPSGSESGGSAGNNSTAFVPMGDLDSATIGWVGGAFIGAAKWLEVKDGSADPATYLFDTSGLEGMTDIVMQNFWPAQGVISHVAIWSGGSGTRLSEPSSLMILGIRLLAVGAVRLCRSS